MNGLLYIVLLCIVAIFAMALCTWAFFSLLEQYSDEEVKSWMEEDKT